MDIEDGEMAEHRSACLAGLSVTSEQR